MPLSPERYKTFCKGVFGIPPAEFSDMQKMFFYAGVKAGIDIADATEESVKEGLIEGEIRRKMLDAELTHIESTVAVCKGIMQRQNEKSKGSKE